MRSVVGQRAARRRIRGPHARRLVTVTRQLRVQVRLDEGADLHLKLSPRLCGRIHASTRAQPRPSSSSPVHELARGASCRAGEECARAR
jgi:hypothetical protein